MKINIFVNYALLGLIFLFGLIETPNYVVAQQEPLFELPVQLVGFPVIILSVRLANFVRKLAYSVNPKTYAARDRRSLQLEEFSSKALDVSRAERQILQEFGDKACVIEEPCRIHAARAATKGEQPDWNDILKHYKVQSTGMKQWYLLSVFLGDIIRDVSLCKQLAKRLECGRNEKLFVRD